MSSMCDFVPMIKAFFTSLSFLHPHKSVVLLRMADMVENKKVVIILENVYHSMSCMLVPDLKPKGDNFCIKQQCSHKDLGK